jgi:hypothetical protein
MYKGLVYYGRLLIIIFCFKFRKRQRTTSDYIYHTLFVNGQDSDITLVALGKLIILTTQSESVSWWATQNLLQILKSILRKSALENRQN